MKVLKVIGIIVGVLLVVFIVVGLMLPTEVHVERSAEINAPTEVVFTQVNTLKNWEDWSPWMALDSAMELKYGEIVAGVGASYSWNSKNENVGIGNLAIKESRHNEHITTELKMVGMEPFNGGWDFEGNEGVTKVTWSAEFNLDIPIIGGYIALTMDGVLGAMFEQGLGSIKEIAEAATPIEAVEIEAKDVLYVTGESSQVSEEISAAFEKAYGEIGAFMGQNGIQSNGMPMTVANNWGDGIYNFDAVIPYVNTGAEIVATGNIKIGKSPSGKFLRFIHKGAYQNLEGAYNTMTEYMKTNGYKQKGRSFELYINDPGKVSEDELLTHVHFPIGS